tara:strand:+ start:331 stop:1596 length:1266 start_codon:yes stop_codon:yes gene_type:complete
MQSESLFDVNHDKNFHSPLADRLRPKSLDEFYGQHDILDQNSILRSAILNDKLGNTIFSGPPGVGKTTLIEIISAHTRATLIKLNAVLSGVKELRNEILLAEKRWLKSKRKTILFIDEVHRFTAIQQDALLPSMENGTIIFIGATTENPSYAVNKALLSRSRVFKLLPLSESDLKKIINRVINHYLNSKDQKIVNITQEALDHLINFSSGDARNLINALELAINTTPINKEKIVKIDLSVAQDSIQNKNIIYDKYGQNHFDIVSAFIKSIRGSDPDATLYWLANMIEAGEDPKYIFRRLYISASEDIGLADPNAIVIINACYEAFEKVGFPEGSYFLSQAALFLAISPKSDSTKYIFNAIEKVRSNQLSLVPDHLKYNSKTYKNPHQYSGNDLIQEYMPYNLINHKIWHPKKSGWENKNTN